MGSCRHEEFDVEAVVNRMEDTGRFSLGVKVRCSQCQEPFRFLGLPAGADGSGAAVSVDGEEARLVIGTRETIANIIENDLPGSFTVRRGP